jgi:hypothetical protein
MTQAGTNHQYQQIVHDHPGKEYQRYSGDGIHP